MYKHANHPYNLHNTGHSTVQGGVRCTPSHPKAFRAYLRAAGAQGSTRHLAEYYYKISFFPFLPPPHDTTPFPEGARRLSRNKAHCTSLLREYFHFFCSCFLLQLHCLESVLRFSSSDWGLYRLWNYVPCDCLKRNVYLI